MTAHPVTVVGVSAAEPLLIEHWMDLGLLPAIARLRAAGAYSRLKNPGTSNAEATFMEILTGCQASRSGVWGSFRFHPDDYSVDDRSEYELNERPPFYALGDGRRVAVFDVPRTDIAEGVDGIQVVGWGPHASNTPSLSVPEGMLTALIWRHGEHPLYNRDECALWDHHAMAAMKNGLETGIARRADICRELMQRERWDLFFTYFGETRTAGHYFWHLSQPDHPLHRANKPSGDWLLDAFVAVDRAIGDVVAAQPPGASIVLFSDHGMQANNTDLPSFVFLPELLYRWSFPGQVGLDACSARRLPPPFVPRASRSWTDEVWARKHDRNPITRALRRRLPVEFFHYAIERRLGINGIPLCPEDCRLGYVPAMWYHPSWPLMKAFALPSFSEGYVRLNIRGRERNGVVDPADYGRVCDEIEGLLWQVRNARTGSPLVQEILRIRRRDEECDSTLPDADLVVFWAPEPADVVDTPRGRIGPIPFRRTGGHGSRGFLLMSGPGVSPGLELDEPRAIDLAPTILSLMNAPVPAYLEGRPVFGHASGWTASSPQRRVARR